MTTVPVATVLVAPDKLKGSLDAPSADRALARGITRGAPGVRVLVRPVADGGDGTLLVLAQAGFGTRAVTAVGPTGRPRRALIGLRGAEAFVELAEVCGLAALPEGRLEGWRSSTFGLGLAVRAALGPGVSRVLIGLGGSASTDGGLGLLAGLGARVLDREGEPVPVDATGLLAAAELDLDGLDPRLDGVELVAVTDVTSPLTGPAGAAAVFGAQKGLDPASVEELDAALVGWAQVLRSIRPGLDARTPGAGAAGGTGAAVLALGGRIEPGAPYVLEAVGFDDALAGADLVVTGEGAWDAQSLAGKAPAEVLRRAHAAGVPGAVVAGRIDDTTGLRELGVTSTLALLDLAPDAETAVRDAGRWLERAGEQLITTPGGTR